MTPSRDVRESNKVVIWKGPLCYRRTCNSMHVRVACHLMFPFRTLTTRPPLDRSSSPSSGAPVLCNSLLSQRGLPGKNLASPSWTSHHLLYHLHAVPVSGQLLCVHLSHPSPAGSAFTAVPSASQAHCSCGRTWAERQRQGSWPPWVWPGQGSPCTQCSPQD